MQALASVASSRLVSSCLSSSRPFSQSVAQSDSLVQSKRIRLQSWSVEWRRKSVVASSDWSSSKASPSRGVVSDDIEGIPVGEYGERYLVPNHMEDEDDGLGDVRVECDENGCIIVVPESRSLAGENNGGGYLRCDLTGCYFSPEAPAVKSFEVIDGEGWRLGYETAPESEGSFCAIVGAGGWSIALTGGEFDDFCTLIQTIRKGIITMDEDEIAGRDDIVLQVSWKKVAADCQGEESDDCSVFPPPCYIVSLTPWLLPRVPNRNMNPLDGRPQETHFLCTARIPVQQDLITCTRSQELTAQYAEGSKVEKGSLWMQCTIPRSRVGALQLLWQPGVPKNFMHTSVKQAFEVRFILSGGASKRQAEGYWPADAVMDMLNKIDSSSFSQPEAPFAENVPRQPAGRF